jgi:hypothetical protein
LPLDARSRLDSKGWKSIRFPAGATAGEIDTSETAPTVLTRLKRWPTHPLLLLHLMEPIPNQSLVVCLKETTTFS